jgi:HNH endonuclease
MVEVPLTQGKVALIDDEDAERVLVYKWCAWWNGKRWYVVAHEPGTGKNGRTVLLHRFIMSAPRGIVVDHRNMNGLDNRRENLRLATDSQNKCNRGRQRDNKSGFKGVSWFKPAKVWIAQIKYKRVGYYLGYYKTAEAAAHAYDAAARKLHGEFARVNFPDDTQ